MHDKTPLSDITNPQRSYKLTRITQADLDNLPGYGSSALSYIGIWHKGKLIAAVREDELFDPHGNRFYIDV